MTTNDSKDQGREAFEAWNDSQTVLEFEDAEAENHALTIFRAGFASALATSASALARDEASVALKHVKLPDIDRLRIAAENLVACGTKWMNITERPEAIAELAQLASIAATVSDAASAQEPIYQEALVGGAWMDVSKERFDAISAEYKRELYPSQAATAAVAQDELAEFEAHWCRDVPSMYGAPAIAEIKANRDGDRYKRDEVQWAWEAWQARASLKT